LPIGCVSAKCEPEIKLVRHEVPVIVPIEAEKPECPGLPAYPAYPGNDSSADARKEWAITVAKVREEREELTTGCIEAYDLILQTIIDGQTGETDENR
jgi:hypothetical protein